MIELPNASHRTNEKYTVKIPMEEKWICDDIILLQLHTLMIEDDVCFEELYLSAKEQGFIYL